MRRLRLVRVTVPEIVAYIGSSEGDADYQCSCGMGVAEEYKWCPYCGSELKWSKVMQPSEEFRKPLERL